MAAELLTITNPSRRRRKMSPKQRAAAMRNLKKARAARGGKRRRNPVATLAANPRKRKRRAKGRVAYRARRRNPSMPRFSLRGVQARVMPALVGGAGAVGNDVLYNFALNALPATLPMLDQFRTGSLRHVGKAASAILLGELAKFAVGRRTADQLTTGALAVVGYNVVRDLAQRFAPSLNLGMYLPPTGLGWSGAGWNPTYGSDWRARTGLSAYIPAGPRTTPGSVNVPRQFNSENTFSMRAAPVYADEFESGT